MELSKNITISERTATLLHSDNYYRYYFEIRNTCVYVPLAKWICVIWIIWNLVSVYLIWTHEIIFWTLTKTFMGVFWTPLETSMEVCGIHGIFGPIKNYPVGFTVTKLFYVCFGNTNRVMKLLARLISQFSWKP